MAEISRASNCPWINNGYAGVAEIPLVSRDDGKASTNGQAGQHSVRQVIIERFTPPTFLFHYPGTRTRVVDSPIEEPSFEEVLKNAFEPFGKIRAAGAWVKTSDTIKDFPYGDGCKTNPLPGDHIEKHCDTRLRVRSHHF